MQAVVIENLKVKRVRVCLVIIFTLMNDRSDKSQGNYDSRHLDRVRAFR